jgi:hypothetical protein
MRHRGHDGIVPCGLACARARRRRRGRDLRADVRAAAGARRPRRRVAAAAPPERTTSCGRRGALVPVPRAAAGGGHALVGGTYGVLAKLCRRARCRRAAAARPLSCCARSSPTPGGATLCPRSTACLSARASARLPRRLPLSRAGRSTCRPPGLAGRAADHARRRLRTLRSRPEQAPRTRTSSSTAPVWAPRSWRRRHARCRSADRWWSSSRSVSSSGCSRSPTRRLLTYVVPRERTIVLGGTAQVGATSVDPTRPPPTAVLERCIAAGPLPARRAGVAHAASACAAARPAAPARDGPAEPTGAGACTTTATAAPA